MNKIKFKFSKMTPILLRQAEKEQYLKWKKHHNKTQEENKHEPK